MGVPSKGWVSRQLEPTKRGKTKKKTTFRCVAPSVRSIRCCTGFLKREFVRFVVVVVVVLFFCRFGVFCCCFSGMMREFSFLRTSNHFISCETFRAFFSRRCRQPLRSGVTTIVFRRQPLIRYSGHPVLCGKTRAGSWLPPERHTYSLHCNFIVQEDLTPICIPTRTQSPIAPAEVPT